MVMLSQNHCWDVLGEKKKSFREKLSIFEGKYKEKKLLSCCCTLDLWWNWEQNQNFSNAVLPQRGAVLLCARHSPLEMLLLSLRKGRNYNVSLAAWDCEIRPKWMTCLPTSPAHDRDFIFLKKLCSRGSWVDLQPFLAHCTNAMVCACLFFLEDCCCYRCCCLASDPSSALLRHGRAKVCGGREQCLRFLVFSLWDSLCLNTF